jgi:DNA repair protein RadB
MKLLLNCQPLDNLLGGGIESGTLAQFYGEAGSGKTNICLQAACSCVSNEGKRVAYIDTEGVSIERLLQIGGKNFKLDKILFFRPYSLEEQERMVRSAAKLNVGLIILDTISMYVRLRYHDDPDGCAGPILRQLEILHITAHKKDIPVIITSQVYSAKNDIRPYGGVAVEYIAKTIVKLEKLGIGKRKATIIKHRSLPEGKSVEFLLTNTGLK